MVTIPFCFTVHCEHGDAINVRAALLSHETKIKLANISYKEGIVTKGDVKTVSKPHAEISVFSQVKNEEDKNQLIKYIQDIKIHLGISYLEIIDPQLYTLKLWTASTIQTSLTMAAIVFLTIFVHDTAISLHDKPLIIEHIFNFDNLLWNGLVPLLAASGAFVLEILYIRKERYG